MDAYSEKKKDITIPLKEQLASKKISMKSKHEVWNSKVKTTNELSRI